jgi:hypothetical protein
VKGQIESNYSPPDRAIERQLSLHKSQSRVIEIHRPCISNESIFGSRSNPSRRERIAPDQAWYEPMAKLESEIQQMPKPKE